MNVKKIMCLWITGLVSLNLAAKSGNKRVKRKPLIRGVYPQLVFFNDKDGTYCGDDGEETGIGAVTSWAGKLSMNASKKLDTFWGISVSGFLHFTPWQLTTIFHLRLQYAYLAYKTRKTIHGRQFRRSNYLKNPGV